MGVSKSPCRCLNRLTLLFLKIFWKSFHWITGFKALPFFLALAVVLICYTSINSHLFSLCTRIQVKERPHNPEGWLQSLLTPKGPREILIGNFISETAGSIAQCTKTTYLTRKIFHVHRLISSLIFSTHFPFWSLIWRTMLKALQGWYIHPMVKQNKPVFMEVLQIPHTMKTTLRVPLTQPAEST